MSLTDCAIKLDEREVRALVKKAFVEAGLEWATIHTFRTTCATNWCFKVNPSTSPLPTLATQCRRSSRPLQRR